MIAGQPGSDRAVIRLTLLYFVVGSLCLYAFKDWFKALCGLILLVALLEHPDMPMGLLNIPGLSPWNFLMACTLLACALKWKKEQLKWDMPNKISVLLAMYVIIMIVAYIRMITDIDGIVEFFTIRTAEAPSKAVLTSEFFVNTLKWLVPGALLFVGCRDEKRFRLGLYCIVAVYVILALQIIRWMPITGLVSGEDLSDRAERVLSREVGYHRVDLSMMLAGAFWALIATWTYVKSAVARLIYPLWIGSVFLGQALTGGRAGYVTWAVIGFAFAWLKWRRYLILAPIAIVLLIAFFPAVQERMMQGFDSESIDTRGHYAGTEWITSDKFDLYTMTAGRLIAWPFVIEKIKEAPLLGHGRRAMQREGVAMEIAVQTHESFPHPHNAYLQFILDNGFFGFIVVMVLFGYFVFYSMRLVREKDCPECIAIGGTCLALLLALAVASWGSQTFYPREGTVGMWCAIGLMMRIIVLRQQQTEIAGTEPAMLDTSTEV